MNVDEAKALRNDEKLLLVTFNNHETRAVVDVFHPGSDPPEVGDGRLVYRWLGRHGAVQVFTVVAAEQGSTVAQSTVQTAIQELSPGTAIAVGIAFGIDSAKQRMGDVLISKAIFPYEDVRVEPDGSYKFRGSAKPASGETLQRFVEREQQGCPRAWPHAWPPMRFGTLLSGAKLIDNKAFRDALVAARHSPYGIIGGEMEGEGIAAAAEGARPRRNWIVVKAICDWADGNKQSADKQRDQQLAAWNSALVVKAAYDPQGLAAIRPAAFARKVRLPPSTAVSPTSVPRAPPVPSSGHSAGAAPVPAASSGHEHPPAGSSATAAEPGTRFEARLAAALAVSRPPALPDWWAAWRAAQAPPLPDLAAFRAAASDSSAALSLLHRLRNAVEAIGPARSARAVTAELKELVIALTLAMAEAYTRLHPAMLTADADGGLRVGVNDALAAAVIAATRFDRGLRPIRDHDTGEVRAADVLRDTAPLELGFQDARQSYEAELLAAVRQGDTIASAQERLSRLKRLGQAGMPHPNVVRMELNDHELRHGARPMFGLPSGSPSPLARDAAQQAGLHADFQVDTYVYGAPAAPAASSGVAVPQSSWAELQGTLLYYVQAILDAIEPRHG